MSEVLFMVEPESLLGRRWHIKRSGSIRATYDSRAQAVMDARQLASFENELRGRTAIVRVLDPQRRVAEDLVCQQARRLPPIIASPMPDAPATKAGMR
jgi:hypothetical protein